MSQADSSGRLRTGIADVLRELSDKTEQLGATLCADPHIASAHMTELQSVDLLAQTLNQLAEVLAADYPPIAIDEVRLDDLRERLAASVEHVSQM